MLDRLAELLAEDLNQIETERSLPPHQLQQTIARDELNAARFNHFCRRFVSSPSQTRVKSQHVAGSSNAHNQLFTVGRRDRDLCAPGAKHISTARRISFEKENRIARIKLAEINRLGFGNRAQLRTNITVVA